MNALLLSLWAVRSLRVLLRTTAFSQVKEYRFDRMRAHLRLPSTRSAALHLGNLLSWGLLLGFAARPDLAQSPLGSTALTLLYAGEILAHIPEFLRGETRRPRPTLKALAILWASAGLLLALAFLGSKVGTSLPLVLLISDQSVPLLVAIATAAASPVTKFQRGRRIRRAAATLRDSPRLRVVGITGSYGKSSTKEFLAAILSNQFCVLKTPANVNTEIGIADVVLRDLRPDHEVFVCEMGAYRTGEIARASALARPDVGILTAIGPQHLDLFGSLEAVVRAKGELLASLPAEGVAIVNGDQAACVAAAAGTGGHARTIRYGLQAGNDVWAEAVDARPGELSVIVRADGERAEIKVPLFGRLHVSNLLAAVAGARALGMELPRIADAAAAIRPLPRTMELRKGPKNTLVIDDTYSANPDGVRAAFESLRDQGAATRLVVFSGMIELGREARSAHHEAGVTVATIRPELIILTTTDFAADVRAGIESVDREVLGRFIVDPKGTKVRSRLEPFLGEGTVLLLEGRIPERVRASLIGGDQPDGREAPKQASR